jgi:hypothetical protein
MVEGLICSSCRVTSALFAILPRRTITSTISAM